MKKFLLLLALLATSPTFSQTPTTAPQVLGCSSPAPAAPPAGTVYFAKCTTPIFVDTTSTSLIASASKTVPVWAHSFSGYPATTQVVACPAGAVVSGSSCTSNGADASALVARSSVAAFSIVPPPVVTTTATLTWSPPTQNTDGTPLTDLASFNVWEGASPSTLAQLSTVSVGTNSYVISGLTMGTTYSFAVSVVNAAGAESTKLVLTQAVAVPKVPGAVSGITLTVP